jgi:membrane-associated phospholipid phosphatase
LKPVCRSLTWALITLISAAFSPAQTAGDTALPRGSVHPPDRSVTAVIADDIGISFHDAVEFYTAPLAFNTTDWNRAATGAGAVAAVMAMDEPLNRLLVSHAPPRYLDDPLEWAKEWGRLRTMQIWSVGVYAGGLVSGHDGIRITGRLMGEALLLAGVPAITLQYGLGRSRPRSNHGAFRFNFFEWADENQSLPSGHTTVAFAVSTVLAKRIDRMWATVTLYTAAGFTALAMAWGDEHWPSDLVVGAALGYLAGSYVVSREEEREAGATESGARTQSRFEAGVGPGGLSVRYRLF